MSFGTAFALPAYSNPLGGGLNPFTQAGPTLDLIFTGVPTVDSTFVGESLELNFLAPQYQIVTQYAVWENNVGLAYATFSDIITFTRASTGTFTDSAGVLQTAAINAPRFDYDPITFFPKGFLIEESRANLLLYSEQFDNAAWVKNLMVVTPGSATAPNGTVTADLIDTATETVGTYPFQNVTVLNSTTYILSVYVKAGTADFLRFRTGLASGSGSIWYSISAGTFSAPSGGWSGVSSIGVGNGWSRVSAQISYGTTDGGVRGVSIVPTASSGATTPTGTVYLWGAQIEAGAFPTSYIPTTTTALTRAADVASINTLSPWYNPAEGTIYAEGSIFGLNTVNRSLSNFTNGTSSNRISMYRQSDAQPVSQVVVGNVNQFQISFGASWTTEDARKMVTAYANANFAACLNGGSVLTQASGTVPSVSVLWLGSLNGTAQFQCGHLRRITYYPRRLTNTELQAITS